MRVKSAEFVDIGVGMVLGKHTVNGSVQHLVTVEAVDDEAKQVEMQFPMQVGGEQQQALSSVELGSVRDSKSQTQWVSTQRAIRNRELNGFRFKFDS